MEEERSEPKVVLLVRLLNAIDEGRHSFEELKVRIADGKPPSTRTLRRYLAILSEAGFPWYFDRGRGTYRFSEGYSLRRLNLSTRELFGVVTLKRLGASLGGTLAAYVDDAAAKILGSADARSATIETSVSLSLRLGGAALDPEVEATFEQLTDAERQRRRVRFAYVDKTGARTQRTVDPYGFIVSNSRIYLVAFDRDRNEMRTFAVDNVAEVDLLPNRFEKPADFDLNAFGANSVSGVLHSTAPQDVTIRFSAIVAKAARLRNVAPQRKIDAHDDGAISITYAVADPLELVRWSLGWGEEAEVIAPEDARRIARELTRKIAGRYAEESTR